MDVVLANGLVGNKALKYGEGLGNMIKNFLYGILESVTEEEAAAFWKIFPRFEPLPSAISKNKVGGAPLLGVDGSAYTGAQKLDKKQI